MLYDLLVLVNTVEQIIKLQYSVFLCYFLSLLFFCFLFPTLYFLNVFAKEYLQKLLKFSVPPRCVSPV